MTTNTTNIEKLKAFYAVTFGDSHTLTFEEYVLNALKQSNAIFERCDIPAMTLEEFLAK